MGPHRLLVVAAAFFAISRDVAAQPAAQVPAQPPAQAAAPATDFVRFDLVRNRDRIETDGRIERVSEIKMLLRDGAAVAAFGQIALPYVDGYGEILFEKVSIEKTDGRQVEVKNALIEDVNPFGVSGDSIAADLRFKKIVIPGLEPGDLLSLRMAIRQKPLVPGRVFGEMKFPGMVSDPLQEYELDLPRESRITVELDPGLGATWEDVPAAADRLVRRLKVRPARPDFGSEGPTEAELDVLNRPDVVYTNFRSWPEVAEWWWSLSKDRLAPDAAVRAEAVRIVAGKTTPREKVDALHTFVASRIRYLSVSFGIGRMQPRAAAEVLANKYGDCKDKVALLAAMASAVGIDVRPVLVHSARKTLIDGAPSPQQFDHMIALVRLGPDAGGDLWLDATNELGPPGYLLAVLRDKPALIVEAGGMGRIARTPEKAPFAQRVEVAIKGSLPSDGPLRARVHWIFRADHEIQLRLAYRSTPADRHSEMVKATLARDWKDVTITNVSTSDPSDVTNPFRVEFDIERTPPDRAPDIEWALSIPSPDFGLSKARKDAKGSEKIVELGLDEFDARAEIELPKGASARPPVSLKVERPFARLTSEYAVEGSLLKVRRRVEILQKSVPATDAAMYESFRKAVDKDGEQQFWIRDAAGGPVASAQTLHKGGLAAYARKDYAKAVAQFEKAVAADPKVTDGYTDLGRALRELGRKDEALAAFSRQIEVDPFHESAYAERAYVLLALERKSEGEKDLLKQIEVAPLKDWSYERLADLRMAERRYDEAARYYAGAASIKPNDAEIWSDLGWAQMLGEKPTEALAAFTRARGLDPKDWLAVTIASGLRVVGDPKSAAELAEQAIAKLAERLAGLTAARFGADDVYWTDRLLDAWEIVGTVAATANDTARAERYLESAWKSGLRPQAAWFLGALREKQRRPADAARLWSALAAMGAWPAAPPELSEHLAAVRAKGKTGEGVEALLKMRSIVLGGTPDEDFNTEIVLLIGPGGRIEGAKNVKPGSQAAFDRVLPRIKAVTMSLARPDERPVKVVRSGILVCNRLSNCSIVLDLPAGAAAFGR